ncbi:hypothetical protein FUAX_52990 (plasmid) [Fulvitalea axinellae]|uniref:RHS repeat-associated core domain-containing protein n=1 Tax=Fulvitalea axinellae TaxID=1182444 RepID=A0AAU9CYL4_9BACT|nr:hypothetical protein FUAX_52990 [Fulvitalea axinellae]
MFFENPIAKAGLRALATLFAIWTAITPTMAQDGPEIPGWALTGRDGRTKAKLALAKTFPLSELEEGKPYNPFGGNACPEGEYALELVLADNGLGKLDDGPWKLTLGVELRKASQEEPLAVFSLSLDSRAGRYAQRRFHTGNDLDCDGGNQYSLAVTSITTEGKVPVDGVELTENWHSKPEADLEATFGVHLDNVRAKSHRALLSWESAGAGVSEYDAEWVFVDMRDGGYEPGITDPYTYKEPVRVSVRDTRIHIDALHPEGRIFARVRAVAYTDDGKGGTARETGPWMFAGAEGWDYKNYGMQIAGKSGEHWQRVTGFAEEGKRKTSVSYFDDGMRNRQAITDLGTENRVAVAENFYDYEGRPSATPLAVPAQERTLDYIPDFNAFATPGGKRGKERNLYDNGRAENAKLDDGSGAARYYSPRNPDANTQAGAMIPDAEGYAYAHTEYTRDATGRVRRQAGAGEAFRDGGGRAVRHFYTDPSQEELYRLFGPNAGDASQYRKKATVDPNGQASLVYTDLRGKTVATALTGEAPGNVDPLASIGEGSQTLEVDLTGRHVTSGDRRITEYRFLNVAPNTAYTFTYNLAAQAKEIAVAGCMECRYAVTFYLIDPAGDRVPLRNPSGKVTDILTADLNASNCEAVSALEPEPMTAVLAEIGEYAVYKEVRVRDWSVEEIRNSIDLTAEIEAIEEHYTEMITVLKEDCPVDGGGAGAEELIAEAFLDNANAECESIMTEILSDLDDKGIEINEENIRAHDRHCEYEYCADNVAGEVYAMQLSRKREWKALRDEALAVPGNKYREEFAVTEYLLEHDPFFTQGYGKKKEDRFWDLMEFELGDDLRGSAERIADPQDRDFWKAPEKGASPVHVLYAELLRTETGEALADKIDKQRWDIYRGYYEEAKKLLVREMARDGIEVGEGEEQKEWSCPAMAEKKNPEASFPDGWKDKDDFDNQVDKFKNTLGLDDGYVSLNTGTDINADRVDLQIKAVTSLCGTVLEEGEKEILTEHIVSYFRRKKHLAFMFGFFDKADVGVDPDLDAIIAMFKEKDCDIVEKEFVIENPFGCAEEKEIVVPEPFPAFGQGSSRVASASGNSVRAAPENPSASAGFVPPSLSRKSAEKQVQSDEDKIMADALAVMGIGAVAPTANTDMANPSIPKKEIDALVDLYNATGGDDWHGSYYLYPESKALWKSFVQDPASVSVSDLAGLTVMDGHVTGIELYSASLDGNIPASINDFRKLTSLNLENNKLRGSVPPLDMPGLTTLVLASNSLSGEMPDLSAFADLETLDLSANAFSGPVSPSISQLENLRVVILHHNSLDGKIPDLGELTYLEKFDINSNKIVGLPDRITSKNITLLNFSNNLVRGIPESLSIPRPDYEGDYEGLYAMPVVFLSYNQLSGLPENFWAKTYGSIFLNNNEISSLPSGSGNTKQIYLRNNKLLALPGDFGKNDLFPGLKVLDIGGNKLSPSVLDDLMDPSRFGNLKTLGVAGAKIEAVPAAFCQKFAGLNTLDLNDNLLLNIPSGFENLIRSGLERLFLAGNRFQEMPQMLSKAYAVTITDDWGEEEVEYRGISTLDLSRNMISELPKLIHPFNHHCYDCGHQEADNKFHHLRLDHNLLTDYPWGSPKVHPGLSLRHNRLTKIPTPWTAEMPDGAELPEGYLPFYEILRFLDLSYNEIDTYQNIYATQAVLNGNRISKSIPSWPHKTHESGVLLEHSGMENLDFLKVFEGPELGVDLLVYPNNGLRYTDIIKSEEILNVREGVQEPIIFKLPNFIQGKSSVKYELADRSLVSAQMFDPVTCSSEYGSLFSFKWEYETDLGWKQVLPGDKTDMDADGFSPSQREVSLADGMERLKLSIKFNHQQIDKQKHYVNESLPNIFEGYDNGGINHGDYFSSLLLDHKHFSPSNPWESNRSHLVTPETLVVKEYEIENKRPTLCLNPTTTGTHWFYRVYTATEYTHILREQCEKNVERIVEERKRQTVDSLYSAKMSEFYRLSETACMDNIRTDRLAYEYTPKEHHYTLYYYDQAGNLKETVPPEGVAPLDKAKVAELAAKKRLRDSGVDPGALENLDESLYPAHRLRTRYQYDALNRLAWQRSPDGGAVHFRYDALGRLRLSQNARQAREDKASYIKYDALGRTVESGEMEGFATDLSMDDGESNDDDDPGDLRDKLNNPAYPGPDDAGLTLRHVTRTHYDRRAAQDLLPEGFPQDFEPENLRKRVSWTERLEEGPGGEAVTAHYSYDIHGNVKSLVQCQSGLEPKRTDYVYDLLSGNVNYVFYQFGKPDQFAHRYDYDADNRLLEVHTSADRLVWHREATYRYYAHGPLRRVELGQAAAPQGTDYYYTLQGWLKGVNAVGDESDPGSAAAKDAFAYRLGYYEGDYSPVNAGKAPKGEAGLWEKQEAENGNRGLYNGNISWMVTDLPYAGEQDGAREKGVQGMLYRYDQLNRLVKARSLSGYAAATGAFAAREAVMPYDTDYSYDANGNILTLERRNKDGELGHKFSYSYNRDADGELADNRLRRVLNDPEVAAAVGGSSKPAGWDERVYDNEPLPDRQPEHYRSLTVSGAGASVEAGRDVEAVAGEILLKPGFEVKAGAQALFRAEPVPEEKPELFAEQTDPDNYVYDEIGNLLEDKAAKVRIDWLPDGKVARVRKTLDAGEQVTLFAYDASGNRISKTVRTPDGEERTTHYLRDASGNPMATYEDGKLAEQPVYGSSRLGLYRPRTGTPAGDLRVGLRNYELTNHLGNVLAVISDKASADGNPDVLSTNDYFPFGLTMKGRSFSAGKYRYGFNGKEKDENGEWGGHTNYDYGFRIYNPAIAKFLSVDPLTKSYPMLTPYQFASNRPIDGVDLDGLEYLNKDEARVKVTNGELHINLDNMNLGFRTAWRSSEIAAVEEDNFHNLVSTWDPGYIGKSTLVGQIEAPALPTFPDMLNLDNGYGANDPHYVTGRHEVEGMGRYKYNPKFQSQRFLNGMTYNVMKTRATSAISVTLEVLKFGLEAYNIYANNKDMELIESHRLLFANNVIKDMEIAINKDWFPEKFKNKQDLGAISNVVLTGVNPSKNKEIYEIGMKIVNEISKNPTIYKYDKKKDPFYLKGQFDQAKRDAFNDRKFIEFIKSFPL